jgi:hypothetical protein
VLTSRITSPPLRPWTGEYLDPAVSLEDADDYNLACGSPTAFALPMPAKRGLVAFYGSLKGLPACFLKGNHRPYQTEEPRHRGLGNWHPETHPVDRNAQDKKLQQPSLGCVRKSTGIPYASPTVSSAATAALEPPVGKTPCTGTRTLRAASHDQNILHFLVRFG